jgi:branched-subunit amino acid aminotransferase/4-amino-4-deoxychorismate lyase
MLPAGEPWLYHNNRAFCYGDALFETIHANGTKLQFFPDHYNRLMEGMKTLMMEEKSLPGMAILESYLVRLLNKNHLYNGVRVRFSIFRNQGGLYTPEDNSVSFLAETQPLTHDRYVINEKGLKTDIFTALLKQPDSLANLKTANALLYIKAGLFKREAGLDDCFILNTEGRLVESISSNLFLIRKGVLFTPALAEGCVAGIMRKQILRIAGVEGIECVETKLGTEDLLSADECFLTNALKGIEWVVAFRQNRYFSKTSRLLVSALNKDQFDI